MPNGMIKIQKIPTEVKSIPSSLVVLGLSNNREMKTRKITLEVDRVGVQKN